jgi:7,8-dihydropterin-6-yl-methyl-4-(beta-D-ribofuranosyl)aminobenzene 5'-phosphate synthase
MAMTRTRRLAPWLCALAALFMAPRALAEDAPQRVRALRVIVLSTLVADAAWAVGEWGFAALVEADGRRVLFDTGARPDTVLRNARALGLDLSGVRDVVLSHNHRDHTGGLLALRKKLSRRDPAALSRAHVGRGIFFSRPGASGERNPMLALRRAYEAGGGALIEHDQPVQLWPGVWLTGPVPRTSPERNFPRGGQVRTAAGPVEDDVPEDQALVFDTDQGLVLLSGCGHAGIINTLTYARQRIRPAPIHAALGGFHLYQASPKEISWTIGRLRELAPRHFLGAHCTGDKPTQLIGSGLGLGAGACMVGAVGSAFQLGKGLLAAGEGLR